jgi:hypothetical protein
LLKEREPSEAAEVLAEYIWWGGATVVYNPDAPPIVSNMADQVAWERFSAVDPIRQKEVAAHCLFRAASYQAGNARVLLVDLAQSLVGEIINTWSRDRTTPDDDAA